MSHFETQLNKRIDSFFYDYWLFLIGIGAFIILICDFITNGKVTAFTKLGVIILIIFILSLLIMLPYI